MTANATAATEIVEIPLASIEPHPRNRKRFNQEDLKELAGSILAVGQLTPVLVRPHGKGYQLLAGERRWRASAIAKRETIACLVRELDDERALEVLMVENNHREDPHPLEEAEIYKDLLAFKGNTVQSLARRLHRTASYIYDRLKLLQLTPGAKRLFLEGDIQLAHAIILARLTKDQQDGLIDEVMFEGEVLLDFEETAQKPISPRELQAHVDKHIRFDASKADPMLFPETVAGLAQAAETGEKVVAITDLTYIPAEARDDKVRTIFPASWERADGLEGSKVCEHSVIGNMVAGTQRGALFRVCIAKKKCAVHWPDEVRAERKKAKAAAKGDDAKEKKAAASEASKQAKKEELIRARLAKATAEAKRWGDAMPAIRKALVDRIEKLPLAQLLDVILSGKLRKEWSPLSSAGRTAEDHLRHVAVHAVSGKDPGSNSYAWHPSHNSWNDEISQAWGIERVVGMCNLVGLNPQKLLDEVAPVEKNLVPKKAKQKTTKKKGAK